MTPPPPSKEAGPSLQKEVRRETLVDRRTPSSLLEGQIRTLLISADTLTTQIAEITVTQHLAQDAMALREKRILDLEIALSKNAETTAEVRAMLEPLRGLFRFIGWIATAVKWFGAVAAAALAIYSLWYTATHEGTLPKIK